MSDRSPSRCAGSSSLSSCPFYTGNYTGGSVWARPWRSGTHPWPPDRPPCWSCSPCHRPRTASSCGIWCCMPAPSDTAQWLSHSPAGWPQHAGSPQHNTIHLETETSSITIIQIKQLRAWSAGKLVCYLFTLNHSKPYALWIWIQ